MWNAMENPPLASYYLALAARIFGWNEIGLHFAFLLPALAVVLGTRRLARNFCQPPVLAALAMLFTPVFMVSSLTVMCDVPMLAFWVWAVVFWVGGDGAKKSWEIIVAGWLIALAEMTKYYGAGLIPLLAAYSLTSRRRAEQWTQFLLIPLAVLCAYQYVTQAAYGYSLLYRAMQYTSSSRAFFGLSKTHLCLTALAFTGGCLAVAIFFAPLLWRPRMLATFAGGAVLIAITLFLDRAMWEKYVGLQVAARTTAEIHFVLWRPAVCVCWLCRCDHRPRDARSWLLGLWVLGTFLFTAFFNWSVNARSILPMAPAVGILIVRRLERTILADRNIWLRGVLPCLAASAALALLVERSDFLLAAAVRQTAQDVCANCESPDRTLWFQGHWGFQYYMQDGGAYPFDKKHSFLKPGDNFALPANNTINSIFQTNLPRMVLRGTLVAPGSYLLTTCNQETGSPVFTRRSWGRCHLPLAGCRRKVCPCMSCNHDSDGRQPDAFPGGPGILNVSTPFRFG